MSRLPRRAAALIASLPVLLIGAPAVHAGAPAGLPLGEPGLAETRDTRVLVPGVSYTGIVRGHASAADFWTLTLGVLPRRAEARQLLSRLEAAGHSGRIEQIDERAPDDPQQGRPLGFVVRTGHLTTKEEATTRQERLAAEGFASSVHNTAEDGRATTGPWVVHVVRVDAGRVRGAVRPVLASGVVPERATVSAIDAMAGSVAAVNGGYFVINPTDGTPGDLAGVSVVGGRLASEAVSHRTSLVLPGPTGAAARIGEVRTWLSVRSSDGSLRELDGLNRDPGLIRSCGGVGGDSPTQRPLHDVTCTDPSELIAIRRHFGATGPVGPGVEVTLDASGAVIRLRGERGGRVPSGGALLQGTGDAESWLRQHAKPGMRVAIRERVGTEAGQLPLTTGAGIVNGGPRLLSGRRVDIEAHEEGFTHPDDPGFYWAFGVRRNPRTIAGLTPDGDLLLVTSDGRSPGYSIGLSFVEEAKVMRALGASDALNLDGGGSTTMVVRHRLVTRPSDATGERPVGDALVVVPRSG